MQSQQLRLRKIITRRKSLGQLRLQHASRCQPRSAPLPLGVHTVLENLEPPISAALRCLRIIHSLEIHGAGSLVARLETRLRLVPERGFEFKGKVRACGHRDYAFDAFVAADVAGHVGGGEVLERVVVWGCGLVASGYDLACVFAVDVEVAEDGVRGGEGEEGDEGLELHCCERRRLR